MDNEEEKINAVDIFAPFEKLDIYLPRQDDKEPRYPYVVVDPLFTANHIYKFSDQILQDRQLFVNKKDVNRSLFSTITDSTDDLGNSSSRSQCSEDKDKSDRTPAAKLITLKLESIASCPDPRGLRRFNEPLNGYVASRKRLQLVKNYERDMIINSNSVMSSVNILSLKKKVSARSRNNVRTLGLPPIHDSHIGNDRAVESWSRISLVRSQTTIPSYSQMPIRLSWKPHPIWRQPTDVLTVRHKPSIETVNVHTLRSEYDKYIRREVTVF